MPQKITTHGLARKVNRATCLVRDGVIQSSGLLIRQDGDFYVSNRLEDGVPVHENTRLFPKRKVQVISGDVIRLPVDVYTETRKDGTISGRYQKSSRPYQVELN